MNFPIVNISLRDGAPSYVAADILGGTPECPQFIKLSFGVHVSIYLKGDRLDAVEEARHIAAVLNEVANRLEEQLQQPAPEVFVEAQS